MALFFSIVIIAAFAIGVFLFLVKMSPDGDTPGIRRWLRTWAIKGLMTPALLWMFFNLGLFERLPSLMPQFDGFHGWARVWAYDLVCATGLFIIGTYWVAVTFLWLISLLAQQTGKRREFFSTIGVWSLLLLPIALIIVMNCGWGFGGVAGAAWFVPIAWAVLPLVRVEKTKPAYHRAVISMNFDRYEEAEAEVLKQLEKSEDDFAGWMMLAELYANHFDDLAGAARIIHETCDHPDATAPEVAAAFHRLADWHLKLGDDPESARRVLSLIGEHFPGSHLERMAKLRINLLPANRRELLEQRQVKRIRLPALGRRLDEPEVAWEDGNEAEVQANRCVEKLKENPDNITAREDLARLLAERLHKVQAGLDQLELLLNQPNQPALKRAEWMGLMAAWQLRYRQDESAGRKILERLIRDYPQAPQAFAAQRRLTLMAVEERMRNQRVMAQPTVRV